MTNEDAAFLDMLITLATEPERVPPPMTDAEIAEAQEEIWQQMRAEDADRCEACGGTGEIETYAGMSNCPECTPDFHEN